MNRRSVSQFLLRHPSLFPEVADDFAKSRNGGALLYPGEAGTGFTDKMTRELRKLMDAITVAKSPLAKKSPTNIDR